MIEEMAHVNLSLLVELAGEESQAPVQFENLRRFLVQRRCTFSGQPMPTLLKPYFISTRQHQQLRYTVEKISSALNKFIALYLADPKVRDLMQFSTAENELFQIEPQYRFSLVISRLDAFLNDYQVKFLEFNCDSPAGTAYADVLEEGFQELLQDYASLAQWDVDYINRQEHLLQALLGCYREFRQANPHFPENPTVAIVDWEDLPTQDEFVLLQRYFQARGLRTLVTSPQKFYLEGERMVVDGEPVHLVYRRVITRELVDQLDQVGDFVQGVKEGLACMCNPFRSFIVGNKKVLDLLTDPRFQHIYDRRELEVIRETIPWTKILADMHVPYKEEMVDLYPFILKNKENLVLKAASSYGGKDVFLGRETDQATWEKVLDQHIASREWVVQEYVPIPQDIFPEIKSGVELKLKKVNINPFAFVGRYGGTITRVSDKSIINVSAGGGIVPTLSIRKKHTPAPAD